MHKIRLAIVGCGSITERGLLPHLMLERDKVDITALCDVSAPQLEKIRRKFNLSNTQLFSDLEELLQNSDAQALAIATPIPLHYTQAKMALSYGRHVYLQKTMTQTIREARELIRLSHEQELKLASSPGQMLLPAYARARKLVDCGVLGTVYAAISHNMAPGHEYEALRNDPSGASEAPDPTWYYKQGGGPLRDMGVYSLHAICGILGRAKKVISIMTRPLPERNWGSKKIQVQVNDNAALVLELEQKRIASITTTFSENPKIFCWGHLAISGTEGSIEIRRLLREGKTARYELTLNNRHRTRPKRETFGTGLSMQHDEIEEAHVARDLIDFIESIAENRPCGASAEEAAHGIEIIEAAERAADTHSAVEIPALKERCI